MVKNAHRTFHAKRIATFWLRTGRVLHASGTNILFGRAINNFFQTHRYNVVFVNLFAQIVSLAKNITGKQDTKAAVKEFKTNITSQDMYFNKDPLPTNETGKQAFKLCNSVEGAMRFCPKRWETLQKWFKASREVIYTWAQLLFYFLFPFVLKNTITWIRYNTVSPAPQLVPDKPMHLSQSFSNDFY